MSKQPVVVQMPPIWGWLFPLGLGAVGFGLGFAVRPVFTWMMNLFDGAPAPLRVVAVLPTLWAVLILTAVGVAAGVWLARQAREEALVVIVDDMGVYFTHQSHAGFVPAEAVAAAMLDGKELILVDDRTRELARHKAEDLNTAELEKAFTTFGHRWEPNHLYDDQFKRWVDGRPGLDERTNNLLRDRGRAMTDGQAGTVSAMTDKLFEVGVVVRDRDDRQEYRIAEPGAMDSSAVEARSTSDGERSTTQ